MRTSVIFLSALALSTLSAAARADRPYVTLTDDGTAENSAFKTVADEDAIENEVIALYEAKGQTVPEVLSVWSTFPIGKSFDPEGTGTYFVPIGNDVTGIGLEQYYPPDGLLTSIAPPLRGMLLHNDLLTLPQRASYAGTTANVFARYLFLLELTHDWGPALNVPAPNAGELIGDPYHWSFWDDNRSLAGGNQFTDNGDGTFTAVPMDYATVKYSMLDLYLMGLATKADVPPFGVLEDVTPPSDIMDKDWGGLYAAHSYPWTDATKTFTATATRRALTIDDIVAANGERSPAAGSISSVKIGIVLLVTKEASADEVASAQATFDPIAAQYGAWFADATSGKGTLDVVTTEATTMGAGGAGGAGGATASSSSSAGGTGGSGGTNAASSTSGNAAPPASSDDGGCSTGPAGDASSAAIAALAFAGLFFGARRRSRLG